MSPSVSVVIPSYESNDTLPAALRSLEAQTVPHRTIIVDDGSSDPVADNVDTGEAVVLRQQNGGIAAARNLGIRHVETEYVAFLDADDIWDARFLERQHSYLEALPGLAGAICAPHPPHDQSYTGRSLVDFRQTLTSLKGGPGTTSWFFRHSAIEAAGCFDPGFRRMEEYELLIRLTGKGFSVLRHDEPLYRYLPSIERGNRYSLAHQQALERFADVYGDDDAEPWLSLQIDAHSRRSIGALMRTRAMNVAALRGDLAETRRLAYQAGAATDALPRSRRAMVRAAARTTRAYVALMQRRTNS